MRNWIVAAAMGLTLATPALGVEVGQPAPDFTLRDLDGKVVKLSDLRGKLVVLEWFNPDCPYVKASHTRGTLAGAAARHEAKDVVWLAVNSAARGKQGHGRERNREAARTFGMGYPLLLDETGEVGRAYGATNTPGMMVVDRQGRLAYRGAIDNSPDGEGESPEGGTLVDHVTAALDDVTSGRQVARPETKQYGCSVKYGS